MNLPVKSPFSRFRAKEALLLAPVLLLAGAAFYWQRLEKFSAPQSHAFYVESVELKTASGLSREGGSSHTLLVTFNHPWPKPRYWGNCCNSHGGLNSLQKPIKIAYPILGSSPEESIASLGEVFWTHDGKTELLKRRGSPLVYGDGGLQEGKYVFGYNLALQKVKPQDELEFHGAFILAGRPFELRRVIHPANTPLPFDSSHYTGGRLLSITPQSWTTYTLGNTKVTEDSLNVVFHVRGDQKPTDGVRHGVSIYDSELIDGKGRIYPAYKGGFFVAWGDGDNDNLPLDEVKSRLVPTFKSNFNPPNPLTLRGKVSIDSNWPIPFSIKLPNH